MTSVTFDPETHIYTVLGKKVPSVTQIVAPFGDDYDEPDEQMELAYDVAAERGTVMHAYLAHRLQGGDPVDFELPGTYEPYAEAVEQFLSEHEVVPYDIEVPFGTVNLAGTPDLVCEFDGVLSILDWKFVSQIAKSKVGAQLAGYAYLCECNHVFPEKLFAVQFLRDSYRLYPVGWDAAREAFFAAFRIYDIKTEKHPRGRIFEEDKK